MEVYETIFGKHFVANAQLMIKIIRYFTYPADTSSRLLDKLQDGSLNVQEALDIAILNFKEGAWFYRERDVKYLCAYVSCFYHSDTND